MSNFIPQTTMDAVMLGVILVSPFFVALTIYALALNDILWTTVREGSVKAVVRGESFVTMILSYKGFHLNDPRKSYYDSAQPDWEILRNQSGREWEDSFLSKILGIYWIGWIWPFTQIYTYNFEWVELAQKENTRDEPWYRNARTNFIYAMRFQYVILLQEAETQGKIPVDVMYFLTVLITNPYKALFSVENWLKRTTGVVNRIARSHIGDRTFEQLISEFSDSERGDKEKVEDLFSYRIMGLNNKLPETTEGVGLTREYGVEIQAADPQTIELSGDAGADLREATTAEYVAKQKAEAVRATARGEADAIRTIADAEKVRIDTVYGAVLVKGDDGLTVRALEAIETSGKSGNSTIWANNPLDMTALGKLLGSKGGSA